MFFPATVPPTIAVEIPAMERRFAATSEQKGFWVRTAAAASSVSWSPELIPNEPAWSVTLSERAARLRVLEAGWSGPGSLPLSKEVIYRAETFVREALLGRTASRAPYLVPGSDGSVQIEWHGRQAEIELCLDQDGDVYLWGRSHISGQEFEGEGEKALALFNYWAPRLAAPNRNETFLSVPEEAYELIAA